MSYSIVRVAKVKGGVNTAGIQKHVQRENKNYNNEDIDHEKTAKEFFRDSQKRIEKDLEKEYGKENLLYATVHHDEATPHMHFGVVPLTKDGRLSAKEVVGNKQALTKFQDRFNEFVNEWGYQLERGESKLTTGKKHETIEQYKDSTSYHKSIAKRAERQALEQEKRVEDLANILEPKKVKYSHFEKKTEVVQKMFGKSEVAEKETGNVVLSKEQYKKLAEQVSAAHAVVRHYKKLTKTDLYQENLQLKKDLVREEQDYERLTQEINPLIVENDKLKKENATLKQRVSDLQANISVLYHHTKIIFKDKFRDFRERINGSMKKQGLDNQFEQEHKKRTRSRNQGLER